MERHAEQDPTAKGARANWSWKDAAIAGGLAFALAVVYAGDRFRAEEESPPPPVTTVEVTETETSVPPSAPKPLKLAVTPPVHDDMGRLLRQLGDGYDYDQIQLDDLLHEDRVAKYDVIFLTCGYEPRSWLGKPLGETAREAQLYTWNESVLRRLKANLRSFVSKGGTLYASDLRYNLLHAAFTEFADQSLFVRGQRQTVEAEVVDETLRERVGPRIDLKFDLDAWIPAAFRGEGVKTYLRGTYRATDGSRKTAPLLLKFPFGEGSVVFTAFHNERQNSETEQELLKFLVLTTVVANVEAKIAKTMVSGGFSPSKRSLLSVTSQRTPIEKKYVCPAAGLLRFTLAFENQGGNLRLSVKAPDGKQYVKQGTSTLTIEAPDAQPGDWTYTITPLHIPFENFPFTLTVWRK